MKKCTKCNRALPKDSDHFRRRASSKDGYDYYCKECLGYRFTDKLSVGNGYKKCNQCEKDKPKSEEYFSKRKASLDGYRGQCIDCIKENRARHYQDNIDGIKVMRKTYREKYRNEIRERKRKDYEKRREQILQQKREYYEDNRENILEYKKVYSRVNREQGRLYGQRRESAKRKLPKTLTVEEYHETLAYFKYECAYCGMTQKEHQEKHGQLLHQEHIVPMVKGGGYTKGNIIPSCRTCNNRKYDQDFKEWYDTYIYYDKNRKQHILNFLSKARDL